MKRTHILLVGAVAAILALACPPARATVTIETVPVGNPGNAADTEYATPGYGAVGYEYNIGKYEVTAGQYTEFLNAVAHVDTYGLYNPEMWSSDYGCKIQQASTGTGYWYSVAADWADRPVNYVSWGDAARFANWLHNGQPTDAQGPGTTETGAYTLNGAMSAEEFMDVSRNPGCQWAIPSEDEWYKAAYHKNDGKTGNYFYMPFASNSEPSNELTSPDGGHNANFSNSAGGTTLGSPYYRTEVGEFELSASPYGTFDQGGNVEEWNEAIILGSKRGVRGGGFWHYNFVITASYRCSYDPTYEDNNLGFRVAQVPEPATLVLLAAGALALAARRRCG